MYIALPIAGQDIDFQCVGTGFFNHLCKVNPFGISVAVDAGNDRNGGIPSYFLLLKSGIRIACAHGYILPDSHWLPDRKPDLSVGLLPA